MPKVRKFSNLKMGANIGVLVAGPQTFPLNTSWISQMVPCRGAKMVMFKATSTDANALQQMFANVINSTDVTAAVAPGGAGSGYQHQPSTNPSRMDRGGTSYALGVIVAGSVFYHDYCYLSLLSNLSNAHTAVTVDVEVYYDGSVDDVSQGFGQRDAVPIP